MTRFNFLLSLRWIRPHCVGFPFDYPGILNCLLALKETCHHRLPMGNLAGLVVGK
jgi:hypothetical protein